MLKSSVPHTYDKTYTNKVGGYLSVYSPLSDKGMAVLNPEAAFLFSLINNKRTQEEIFDLAKQTDPSITLMDVSNILDGFLVSEIIYFNKPKTKEELALKKPQNLGVWLHVTNECNLRCTYCYVGKTAEKMSEATAQKALQKIFSAAAKHDFKNVTIKFSGGECLLELPLILNLVKTGRELANKNNLEVDFVVLTNGVLLTEEVCKTLKQQNLRVAVSLDGLGEYNDSQRIFANGKGSFKYVERGIQNLALFKIPFNVSVTITSKNVKNLPKLTSYLLKLGIPFAFNFYRENPYVKEELDGNDEEMVTALKKAYKLISENPPPYSLMNGLLDRVTFTRPHLFTCGVGVGYIVVRHDGKTASCQMTLENPIGSIDDDDLVETMRSGNFIKPHDLTVEEKTPCNTCPWKYICCGGCPLLSFEQKGRFNTNSPYCAVYKALIPEVLKIEAKRIIKYGFSKDLDEKDLPSLLP